MVIKIKKENHQEIISLYVDDRKTLRDISKIFNVSPSRILHVLDCNKIEKRSISEALKIRYKNKDIWNKGKKCSKEQREKISEAHRGRYIGKSWDERYGKDKSVLMRVKLSNSLKGKRNSPSTEFKRLEKHPSWNGGSSFEPYDKNFNELFKKEIKNRDKYMCMLCETHKKDLKDPLSVHHVDYNKILSIKENCISLCTSCHQKTNFNRKHWTKFFQSLLSERFRYKY